MKNILGVILLSSIYSTPIVPGDMGDDANNVNAVFVDNVNYETHFTVCDYLNAITRYTQSGYETEYGTNVATVDLTYNFNIVNGGWLPMYWNYIEINYITVYISNIVNIHRNFYSSYSDSPYTYTFSSPYRIYFNYLNPSSFAFVGINDNVIFRPSLSFNYEYDNLVIDSNFKIGDFIDITISNNCDDLYYSIGTADNVEDTSNLLKGDFNTYLRDFMDSCVAWGDERFEQGRTSGSGYDTGYGDGYLAGSRDGIITGGGMNDIFSAMTKIFNAAASVLDKQVFPGLTLGGILSIPIVAIIVVVVFKIAKG